MATGQSKDIDPEVLQGAWNSAQAMLSPELRAAGMFAEAQAVAEDAPLADRLLAFAGRKI